MQANTR